MQIGNTEKCSPITPDSAREYSFEKTQWKLFNAKDAQGNFWNNSSLVFTSQKTHKNRQILEGYFDWNSDGTNLGREYFKGYLNIRTSQIVLQGDLIKNSKSFIRTSKYQAMLCSDKKTISHGKWTAPKVIPGEWSASLVKRNKQKVKDAPIKLYVL